VNLLKKQIAVCIFGIFLLSSGVSFIPNYSGQEIENSSVYLNGDCNCGGAYKDDHLTSNIDCCVMSSPIDCTQLTITHPSTPIINTPDDFNWADHKGVDWTTPVKHQGNCGSCWAFAALGALESRINIMEDCYQIQSDLSEQYVLSCLPAAANNYGLGCLGGTPYKAFYYIQDDGEEGNYVNGVIPEWCFPYEASHTVSCTEKCTNWTDYLVPITNCTETFLGLDYATEENTDIIKSIIYNEGPIAVALNVTQHFINFWNIHHSPNDYYPDTHEPWGNMLNHIVMLVGWKDNPEIPNGGYWIVKNSWGTEWGYDGFFNIEYFGLFIGMYYATGTYDPDSVNWAPIVDAGGLYFGEIGESITFDSSNSIDPEGDIVTYEWDFGDGTNGTGATPIHSYTAEGIYAVTLTVTDSQGNSGKDTALVGIGEEPLIIDATGLFGIDITVENSLNFTITNLYWKAQLEGLIFAGKNDGIIPELSNDNIFTVHIPVLGLGIGSIIIDIENIQKTESFLIIGPLVFGLHRT
jgi:C1A family cysteine protease